MCVRKFRWTFRGEQLDPERAHIQQGKGIRRPKLHIFLIHIRLLKGNRFFCNPRPRRDPPPPPPLRQRGLRLRSLVGRGERLRQGRAVCAAEACHHGQAEVRNTNIRIWFGKARKVRTQPPEISYIACSHFNYIRTMLCVKTARKSQRKSLLYA